LKLSAEQTRLFAIELMLADTPANSGKGICGGERGVGALTVPLDQTRDEAFDIGMKRARFDAGGIYAIETPERLCAGLIQREAQRDFSARF
jgi:hypothetical protein